MGGDDLQIGVDPTDITVVEDALGLYGRGGGLALLFLLVREDAQGDEVVFYLLIGGEDGLAIGGGSAVLVGARFFGEAATPSPVIESFADGGSEGVDETGFLEERGEASALLAGSRADVEGGEVSGAGDANLLVGGGGAALGCGDVGAALEELRR